MPRYAIGDIQGCYAPLRELLRKLDFSADRDRLYFVGDLVNRGPQSLEVLRFIRSLGEAASTVLGNHDLHLLALHHDSSLEQKHGDTLHAVLAAPDRTSLMEWLQQQPLAIDDAEHRDLIVHAGLVPDWSLQDVLTQARAASLALNADPGKFLAKMYGNKPVRWHDAHTATERHRFTINVLTRLRYCRADGTIDMKRKDAPGTDDGPWKPWFEHPGLQGRERRVVFGHWSTLGLVRRPDVLALDTGCLWGGKLTAVNLDDAAASPVQIACQACRQPGPEGV